MRKMFKKEIGITLVALVITIIILLILAGITISQLTGSGLFENAKLAEQKSKEEQKKEEGTFADYENKIGEYIDSSNREDKASNYKVTLLWEGNATSGDIRFLNNYTFDEFDTVKFIYSDNGNLTQEREHMVQVIDYENGNFSIGLYGYANYHMNLQYFTNNGFSITSRSAFVLNKVYGINY